MDADHPGFEGLAQRVEYGGGELRGLVKEQHAMIGPHRGARPDLRAPAAHQRRRGRGVMRAFQGRTRRERTPDRQAGQGSDGTDLEGSAGVQIGKQPRQPRREHGLPRAGWADQEEVVPSGRRHQYGVHRLLVADHLARGRSGLPTGSSAPGARDRLDRNRLHAAAMPDGRIAQGCDAHNAHARHQGGFVGIAGRHHHRAKSGPGRGEYRRQHPVDRPQSAVQAQFAQMHNALNRLRIERRPRRPGQPGAIPRSNPDPCFGSAAGDRLTVSFRLGNSQPEFTVAARTRSLASPSAVSGRPMMRKPGRLLEMSASISTIAPRSPSSDTECVRPTAIKTPAAGGRIERRGERARAPRSRRCGCSDAGLDVPGTRIAPAGAGVRALPR